MAVFCRAMRIDKGPFTVWLDRPRKRGGSGRYKAIDHHKFIRCPGANHCTRHRADLEAAEVGQRFNRRKRSSPRSCAFENILLVGESGIVEARPSPDEFGHGNAAQFVRKQGCSGSVRDAHLAETDDLAFNTACEMSPLRNRLPCRLGRHRRPCRTVGRSPSQRQIDKPITSARRMRDSAVNDGHRYVELRRDDIRSGSACKEVGDHLAGNLLRERGHTLCGNPMISCENGQRCRSIRRSHVAKDRSSLNCKVLEPSQ